MSYELRWFFEGSIPEGLLPWAKGKLNAPKEERRTDYYFVAPKAEYLGVKGRGAEGDKRSKIEVKWRTRALEPIEFCQGVSGIIEDWKKQGWKSDANIEDDLKQEIGLSPSGPWVAVKKLRRQWGLAPGDASAWQAVTGRVDRGLKMEITELEIRRASWWTLGFDIFLDEEAGLVDFVKQGLAWLTSDYPGPPLKTDRSFGYPKFTALASIRFP